jgi:hypothetical protein
MTFVVRGRTGANEDGIHAAWVERYTYISEPHAGFYQWDGVHRVKLFLSPEAALAAVPECVGPLFRVPAPQTIEAVEVETARLADSRCAEDRIPPR